jgi:hypothetical protein
MAALSTVAQDDDLYCSALNLMMQHEQQKHQQLRQQLMQQNAAGMDAFGTGQYSIAIEYFRRALDTMPANVNIALNLLQAISMRERLTSDLRALAQHCVEVIAAGRLPQDQEKRYQVILGHLDL